MIETKVINPPFSNPPYKIRDRFRTFLPVVVDVETGGFNPATDALLEVCMMTLQIDNKGRLAPKDQYSVNIRPFEGANIVQVNIDFLGIDPYDESRNLVDEADAIKPLLKTIAKEVKAQECTKAILVGHNGAFDLSFINAVANRVNYKRNPFHPFSVIDTASLGALVLGQTVLSRACHSAGISFNEEHAHSAVYDTEKECELFCAMYNRFTKFAGLPG
ncbi:MULTISPECIES: ribonuclease T [unclassified Anaerobiospirillum]|uniref:ribonuclease T n=1 Tax=unclassified Anaerobiospirillum TaxID=2647410 RepID=UPI001FF0F7A7|nr:MULTISPECIES: ribonuclease T [unclassified Anaerobiospirillum]MCK0527556.1 ribonuclease T [Anaerobiospirillum sp. NML120449]MCK0535830.1 ribonuclease T [Anaerobiospirillum sp. NML120511]MCK0541091.1 ribonuclease T [Anaerobiospirillum sp. NML02-A-032]